MKKYLPYLPWLGVFAVLVLIFGTMYALTQQNIRMSANYPLIDLASQSVAQLDKGVSPQQLINGSWVDESKSLQPFVQIYDKSGKYVAGSAFVHEAAPEVPVGVLRAADSKPYHSVTWQPASDVRAAAVTMASERYYVLAGRSLSRIETDESHAFLLALIGGVLTVGVLGAVYFLTRPRPA